jgi:hypothetical protein
MYHKKVFVLIALALVMLLAACGKASRPANPTLTFGDNTCSYSGPNSVPYTKVTLDFVQAKGNSLEYGFALVTLHSGKTIADLKAWPSTDPPEWLSILDDNGYLVKDMSFSYDLSTMGIGMYHPYDSLYLVCFQMNAKGEINKIGAFGPIKVTK